VGRLNAAYGERRTHRNRQCAYCSHVDGLQYTGGDWTQTDERCVEAALFAE